MPARSSLRPCFASILTGLLLATTSLSAGAAEPPTLKRVVMSTSGTPMRIGPRQVAVVATGARAGVDQRSAIEHRSGQFDHGPAARGFDQQIIVAFLDDPHAEKNAGSARSAQRC